MAISRNLVGRESVAWVQIPPSPPKKGCPLVGQSFFASVGALRNLVAHRAAWGKRCRRHLSAQSIDYATNRPRSQSACAVHLRLYKI